MSFQRHLEQDSNVHMALLIFMKMFSTDYRASVDPQLISPQAAFTDRVLTATGSFTSCGSLSQGDCQRSRLRHFQL